SGQIVLTFSAGVYSNIRVQETTSNCIGGSLSATLSDPVGPALSENHADESCPGASDGSIDLTVTGGTPGFSYDWDNDGIGDNDDPQDLNGLSAGTYNVTVTDAAGCSATLGVTIQGGTDITPPTALCQNISVALDNTGNANITASQVDAGSSDNCSSVSLSINQSAFNCGHLGANSVILTVTDGSNNSATCTATVTIQDNTPPTAICQNVTAQLDANGLATADPALVNNGSSDNCGGLSFSLNISSFSCADVGNNPVILTVSDGSGNTATCAATVFVVDNIPPVAACQDITVDLDLNGVASVTPAQVDAGSSDNCGNISLSLNTANFTCTDIGPNLVTLTVNDGNGNTSDCMATVTIEDNLAPTALCQNISVGLDNSGNANITAVQLDAGSSDNCSSVSLSINQSAFNCGHVGANSVILTVTDAANNSATCTATVTIQDNTPPTAICQNVTAQLDANGTATVDPASVNNGSSDNCGGLSFSLSPSAFSCAEIGNNAVVLTVDDGHGNTATCSATVLVEDLFPPMALCQDVTISVNASGVATLLPEQVDAGSSDNCSLSLSLNTTNFGCSDIGMHTVTLTVSDGFGNSDNCTATVTVEDATAPNAFCQNITKALDGNGLLTLTPPEIDAGSSDNCGGVSLSLDKTQFNCDDIGLNIVTLTVTDQFGNTDQCQADLTVVDNFLPMASCQDITVSLDAAGSALISPQDVDNGSSDNCSVSLFLNISNFNCTDIGANTVILTADDGNGNTATCNAIVTVEDNLPPTPVCQDITVQLDANGLATITAEDIGSNSSDNCTAVTLEINQSNFNCTDLGNNAVTLSVSDDYNNISTCVATVTVEDNLAPVAICQDITVALDATGVVTITEDQINDGSSDNCANIFLSLNKTLFDCSDLGANTVVLTVDDGHGNTADCGATVTVEDNLPPVAACQDITVSLDITGNVTITPQSVDGGSTDNCGLPALSLNDDAFSCNNLGQNLVMLTVSDGGGNTDNCLATVTVEDNLPPNAQCLSITVSLDTAGMASITASQVDAGSTDNCQNIGLSINNSLFDCSNIGSNVVTLTVDDNSGNTDECDAVVIVEDNLPPVAVCQDISLELDASGQIVLDPAQLNNGSSDNCGTLTFSANTTLFDCSQIGPNSVTLTVTDEFGNPATCQAVVTITETTPPTALCQNISVALDTQGMAAITAQQVDGGSADNCGQISISIDTTQFDCADLGIQQVVLTVTDGSGNASTCTAEVTILDDIPPMAVCKDITVSLNASGQKTVFPSQLNDGSTDNCQVINLMLSQTQFDCSNVGPNPVTLTVSDDSGNATDCAATITVEDNAAPTALCQNITIELDATGQASVTPAQINNGSSDNCGNVVLGLNQSAFDCSNIGQNLIQLTVTDDYGNVATCNATVTVRDLQVPVALCQNISVELDSNGMAVISPAQIDAGSSDNCPNLQFLLSQDTFLCDDEGLNPITLTVTDLDGNATNCTATVDVNDTTIPTMSCQNITVFLDSAGMVTITPQMVDNGSFDNCSLVNLSLDQTQFDCSNVGPNSVILTGDDQIGSANQCAAVVTVQDTLPPLVTCADLTVFLGVNNMATITPEAIEVSHSDNCGPADLSLSQSVFNCQEIGANMVTLFAEDAFGNVATCQSTVTVNETTPPVAVCQDLTVQLNVDGQKTVVPEDLDAGSSDNCGQVFFALSQTDFDCASLGANPVTLTVDDGHGNSAQCNAVITVEDQMAPTAHCKDVTVFLDVDGMAVLSPLAVDDNSTDNCTITDYTLDKDQFDCADIGTQILTLTLTDQSANTAQCIAIATIQDTIPPLAVAQDITANLDANGMVTFSADLIENGSSDNCGIDTFYIDNSTFSCSQIGANTVVLTVEDAFGNVASATATVTIQDLMPPVVLTQNITIALDANGMAQITPADLDAGSTDNCSIVEMSLDVSQFDCANIGVNLVTLTATDQSGNTGSAVASVTVIDDMPPTLVCPTTYSGIECGNFITYELPQIEDNCSNGSFVLVSGLPSGAQFPAGNTQIVYQYTDLGGNSAQCAFLITAPKPLVISQISSDPVLCNDGSDGSISVFPKDGIPPYDYLWNTSDTTQTISGLPAGSYSVTVTDSIGCQVSANVNLPEPMPIVVTLDSLFHDANMGNTGAIYISVAGGAGSFGYAWIHDGQIISNQQDLTGLAAGDYQVQVTDNHGCVVISDIFTIDPIVSTSEPVWANGLTLVPNPSDGRLFVELTRPPTTDLVLEAFNLIGQKVPLHATPQSPGRWEIQFDAVPDGVYLIRIKTADGEAIRRVMIAR
ncbi:MAG: HYR domain-containing protein, partial [Bacteroidetes bacterium]